MKLTRIALCSAAILALFSQQPLGAQPGVQPAEVDAEYDDFDTDLSDDVIDIETGEDNIADEIGIYDEDGEPSNDDEEDDSWDDDLFYDRLPEIIDYGESEEGPMEARGRRASGMAMMGIRFGTRVTSMVAGFKVKDGASPFLVQIKYTSNPRRWNPPFADWLPKELWMAQHICGGSLIAPQWVLTAAHCVREDHIGKGMEVVIGSPDIAQPNAGQRIRVDRVVLHEDHELGTMYDADIALVHLVAPANAKSVRLNTQPRLAPGSWLSVLGWGKRMEHNQQWASAQLFRADLQLIDNTACSKIPDYGPQMENGQRVVPIHSAVMCGGSARGKACSGDSGGPVVLTNGTEPVLVGIVSWTRDGSCEQLEFPGVFTRVSSYYNWIRAAMRVTQPGETVLPRV